jgi:hypothetical protein
VRAGSNGGASCSRFASKGWAWHGREFAFWEVVQRLPQTIKVFILEILESLNELVQLLIPSHIMRADYAAVCYLQWTAAIRLIRNLSLTVPCDLTHILCICLYVPTTATTPLTIHGDLISIV